AAGLPQRGEHWDYLPGTGNIVAFSVESRTALGKFGADRSPVTYVQSRFVQESAVSRCRRDFRRSPHDRSGGTRRVAAADADYRDDLPDCLLLDRRAAAVQWFHQRVAHLSKLSGRLGSDEYKGADCIAADDRRSCPDRGAGGCVFCEGLRSRVSGAAAQRGGRTRNRGSGSHAGWNDPAGGGLRADRNSAGDSASSTRVAGPGSDSREWRARGNSEHRSRDSVDRSDHSGSGGDRGTAETHAEDSSDMGLRPFAANEPHAVHIHGIFEADPVCFYAGLPAGPQGRAATDGSALLSRHH